MCCFLYSELLVFMPKKYTCHVTGKPQQCNLMMFKQILKVFHMNFKGLWIQSSANCIKNEFEPVMFIFFHNVYIELLQIHCHFAVTLLSVKRRELELGNAHALFILLCRVITPILWVIKRGTKCTWLIVSWSYFEPLITIYSLDNLIQFSLMRRSFGSKLGTYSF